MYQKRRVNPFIYVNRQKKLIERDYDCFKCEIKGPPGQKYLECFGVIKPTDLSSNYYILIKYDGKSSPSVYVVKPEIPYDIKAHMYRDKSLCLYDPREDPWNHRKNISDTIIPWTAEWLVYYEIYQITGKWEGPEALHGDSEKNSLKDR